MWTKLENGPDNKTVKVVLDAMSAAYKATALKAVEDMPAEGTIEE